MGNEVDPAAGTEQNLSLREEIDRAFSEHERQADEAPPQPGAPDDAAAARARDGHGRFAPGSKAPAGAAAPPTETPPAAPPGGPQGAATPGAAGAPPPMPPAPGPGDLKAPASWRPEAREKWAAVDPAIREEVHRRESELQRVLQQGSQARQFIDAFERTVAPYEVFIRQENSTPLQAVQNLMQTAADLRVGTPQHKAQLVAGICKNFSIDLRLLDSLLAGEAPAPGAPQVLHDPRLDQLLFQQQQAAMQAQQREQQTLQTHLQTFAEKHEFYRDVAGTMADLVEVWTRRGQPLDLEKIYDQACKMDEGVSKILHQRAAAAKAGQQSQAVLRAKSAAVSVKGDPTPAGATVPKNDSIRASIEAAIESLGSA